MPLMTTRKTPRPGSEEWWARRDDERRRDRLLDARKRLVSGNLAPPQAERPTGIGPDVEELIGKIRATTERVRAMPAPAAAPRAYTDAELLRPDEPAEAMAYDARRRALAPGGAAAGGARAAEKALLAAAAATPDPFRVTEPTQVGYEEAQLGYHPGEGLRRDVGYRGRQVETSGMGTIRHEATPQQMAAPVGPGEFAVRLSGSYPEGTAGARDARASLLAGQRWAYLQGGTGAVDAYNAALEGGADEAAARDAVGIVRGQNVIGGPPMTGGEIAREQARTEAGTAQAEAAAAVARTVAADPEKYVPQIAQADPIAQAEALTMLAQALRDAGQTAEADEVLRRAGEGITGRRIPPTDGFWLWLGKTIGGMVRAPYDIVKGAAAGVGGEPGG